MAGKRGPTRNPVPRNGLSINERQERFARIYGETLDVDRALEESGYVFTTEESKRSIKSRLLRNAAVMGIVDEIRVEAAKRAQLTAAWVLERYRLLYLEASRTQDWATACSALRDIGKSIGLFQKHQEAKRAFTEKDFLEARRRLTEAGMDFTRINWPTTTTDQLSPQEN